MRQRKNGARRISIPMVFICWLASLIWTENTGVARAIATKARTNVICCFSRNRMQKKQYWLIHKSCAAVAIAHRPTWHKVKKKKKTRHREISVAKLPRYIYRIRSDASHRTYTSHAIADWCSSQTLVYSSYPISAGYGNMTHHPQKKRALKGRSNVPGSILDAERTGSTIKKGLAWSQLFLWVFSLHSLRCLVCSEVVWWLMV